MKKLLLGISFFLCLALAQAKELSVFLDNQPWLGVKFIKAGEKFYFALSSCQLKFSFNLEEKDRTLGLNQKALLDYRVKGRETFASLDNLADILGFWYSYTPETGILDLYRFIPPPVSPEPQASPKQKTPEKETKTPPKESNSEQAEEEAPVVVESYEISRAGRRQTYICDARVRNRSEKGVRQITVLCKFYSREGKSLGQRLKTIAYLNPGQSERLSFSVDTNYDFFDLPLDSPYYRPLWVYINCKFDINYQKNEK